MASSRQPKRAGPAEPRDAASLVLVRRGSGGTRVLMGVRGSGARFMPERRVFPGGAVDPDDLEVVRLAEGVQADCLRRLRRRMHEPHLAPAFALTAIRETWEEAGLAVGTRRTLAVPDTLPGGSWREFLSLGLLPSPGRLRFVFRAITPRSYSIRFDARFFMADAEAIAGDVDDLSRASGELQQLAWLPIHELAVYRDLPRITRVVLKEVIERVCSPEIERPVPFFAEGERSPPEELF